MRVREARRKGKGDACGPAVFLVVVVLAGGCSTVNVTVPPRSATEQLLITTAADRAIARHTALSACRDRTVFVDVSNLEAYERQYVAFAVRGAVGRSGGRLVDERDKAGVILEAASGALSIDKTSFIIGIPELTVPIPTVGSLPLPEVALFKYVRQKGKAKIGMLAYEGVSRATLIPSKSALGSAYFNSYWMLFLGPFDFTNLPPWPTEPQTPAE